MRMKRWLSLLCVAAVLLALVPAALLPVSAGKTLVHRKETTLMEKILERDGFIEGIWYPWFTHQYLGCSLTSNELAAQWLNGWGSGVTDCWYDFSKVGIDEYGADKIYREIYNLKSLGYNLLGYEGSIYGEGVIYDNNGDVLGIKQEYLYNVRRLLDMCRSIGMPVLWTVCCHSSSVNHYYTNGKLFWDRACRFYTDPTVADHYAERFVKPLAKVLAEYPDVVAMVAVTSEAENEMNESQVGNYFGSERELYGTTQDNMLYFINAVNEAVKATFPEVPRTICSQLEDMSLYSDIDFDILGDQNYNGAGRSDPIDAFRPTVPMFVSEFGLGDELTFTDDELTKMQIIFRDNFRKTGYKGCVMWCWQPDSKTGSAYDLLKKGAKNTTDFRSTAYDLYYYIEEQRDKYRGDKTVLDTPQLFFTTGNGLVEWVVPRQATKMDFLRSDDGGKTWVKELDNVDVSKYVTGHKGQCLSEVTPGANTVYKIVVRDGKGNEKSSAVSNRAVDDNAYGKPYTGASEEKTYDLGKYPLNLKKVNVPNPMILTSPCEARNRPSSAAANMLKDGGFESSLGGFTSASTLKAVADKTAPEGSKSLYFDTSSSADGQWHIFWVEVEKYTDYVFSTWIKGADLSSTNRGYASIGVVDPDTKRFIPHTGKLPFYTQSKQIVPSAWDGEWHLRGVGFNSQNRTKIGIAVYGGSSKMWVDGMALFKNGEGVKYLGQNMAQNMSYRYDVDYSYCTEKNSLLKNPTFDQSSSTFWQTGAGWYSGFLSIASNKYEYGASLKYTATSDPRGLHYIKWVDVEPNTWYTFSANVKVLESGAGKMVLLDGKMSNPAAATIVEMDAEAFGNDWIKICFRLNTGVFTRLGIGVVDLGGSALIDNLRLFKTSDGIEGADPFKDKSGNTVTTTSPTIKPTVNRTTKATTTTQVRLPVAPSSSDKTTSGNTTTGKGTSNKTTAEGGAAPQRPTDAATTGGTGATQRPTDSKTTAASRPDASLPAGDSTTAVGGEDILTTTTPDGVVGQLFTVTADTAEVWSGIGEDRTLLATLTKDSVVEVLAAEGEWMRILYEGVEAYVSASAIADAPVTNPSEDLGEDTTTSTDAAVGDTTTMAGENNTDTDIVEAEIVKKGNDTLIFVIGGAVLLIGGGIALFLILRKKKSN